MADAIEHRDQAGLVLRVRRGGRARLAHLGDQAVEIGMLAANGDRIIDALQRAKSPVDHVRARRIDPLEFRDIEQRVGRDFGVAELFFDLGNRPYGPVARDEKDLPSLRGGLHLEPC